MSATRPTELTGRCNCGTVPFVAAGFPPGQGVPLQDLRRQSGHYLAATDVRREKLTISDGGALTCGVHFLGSGTAPAAFRS